MSLSPLAERIYQTLLRQVRLPNPLISYGDLVRALGPLPPPENDLQPNDQRLFEALGEVARACRSHKPPLPGLTAIVVRREKDGTLGTPGPGYFALSFPEVRGETARIQMWRAELKRVVACSYPTELASTPKELTSTAFSRPKEPRDVPRWLREPTIIAAIIGLAGTLVAVIIPVYISTLRSEPSPMGKAERVVVAIVPHADKALQPGQTDPPDEKTIPQKVTIVPQTDKPSQPHQFDPPEAKPAPPIRTLDTILDLLERHHQRATFGAVAGVLGREPQSLLSGYERTPKTAWVVNKTTGLPTGTKKKDYPPGLLEKERVIRLPEELRRWLREHR